MDVIPMNASNRLSVRPVPARIISKILFCTLLFTGRAAGQADQGPAQLGGINSHPGDSVVGASASNVYVSVREPNGLPVTESATVKLSCPLAGVNMSGPTKDTALAQFSNIPPGDCVIEVSAPGYKPAHERALVADSLMSRNQYVYVYLHLASESGAAGGRTQVSLNVLKEMDKAAEAIHKNHADEARKHLLKARRKIRTCNICWERWKPGKKTTMRRARDSNERSHCIRRTSTRCWRLAKYNCAASRLRKLLPRWKKRYTRIRCRTKRSFIWRRHFCSSGIMQGPSHTRRRRLNLRETKSP
jgi:hypothetical protein